VEGWDGFEEVWFNKGGKSEIREEEGEGKAGGDCERVGKGGVEVGVWPLVHEKWRFMVYDIVFVWYLFFYCTNLDEKGLEGWKVENGMCLNELWG
jgi:hypothetical protein